MSSRAYPYQALGLRLGEPSLSAAHKPVTEKASHEKTICFRRHRSSCRSRPHHGSRSLPGSGQHSGGSYNQHLRGFREFLRRRGHDLRNVLPPVQPLWLENLLRAAPEIT